MKLFYKLNLIIMRFSFNLVQMNSNKKNIYNSLKIWWNLPEKLGRKLNYKIIKKYRQKINNSSIKFINLSLWNYWINIYFWSKIKFFHHNIQLCLMNYFDFNCWICIIKSLFYIYCSFYSLRNLQHSVDINLQTRFILFWLIWLKFLVLHDSDKNSVQ